SERFAQSGIQRGAAASGAKIRQSARPGGQTRRKVRADPRRQRGVRRFVDAEDAGRWLAGKVHGARFAGTSEEASVAHLFRGEAFSLEILQHSESKLPRA